MNEQFKQYLESGSTSKWRTYVWKVWLRVEDIKDRIGNRCFHCGGRSTKRNQLEFAHLEPTGLEGRGRGAHHRRLDLLKHLDKYTYLCHCCHKDFDNGNRKKMQPESIEEKLNG